MKKIARALLAVVLVAAIATSPLVAPVNVEAAGFAPFWFSCPPEDSIPPKCV